MAPIIDPEKCPVPEVERIEDFQIIQNCQVPAAPLPISECQTAPQPDTTPPPPPPPLVPHTLVDCRGQAPVRYAIHPLLSQLVGQAIALTGDPNCYQVRVPTCNEAVAALGASPIGIRGVYASCQSCGGCWQLTHCNSLAVIVTNQDMSQFEGGAIKLPNGECYGVARALNCLNAVSQGYLDSYPGCLECQSCYHLECCHDATDTLVAGNNLALLANMTAEELVENEIVFGINGKCYKVTAWDQSCSGVQTVTIDVKSVVRFKDWRMGCNGEESEVEVLAIYPDCASCSCFKLTQCNDETPTVRYARGAIDTDDDPIVLRDYVDKFVRLDDDGLCYLVEEETTTCTTTEIVKVQEAYDECEQCVCYTLTNCEDAMDVLNTFKDLAGLGFKVGDVLKTTVGVCYTITNNTAVWDDTDSIDINIDPEVYPNCTTCLGNTLYRLTHDCQHDECDDGNASDPFVTDQDFHAAIGKWVAYKGVCRKISQVGAPDPGEETIDAPIEFDGPFDTCEECLNAPKSIVYEEYGEVYHDVAAEKLKQKVTRLIFRDGLFVGFCELDPINIADTDECA